MDDIPLFPGVDKVVHFCMYGGMSGMLWLEFLRNHRGGDWFDFLANTCGVIAATAFAWFVLRPWIVNEQK